MNLGLFRWDMRRWSTCLPWTFEEFLWANGVSEAVIDELKRHLDDASPVPESLHKRMRGLMLQYAVVGGMTDAVQTFVDTKQIDRVLQIQRARQLTKLLSDYEEILDLRERRETVEHLLSENHQLNFQTERQGWQLVEIDARLSQIGNISNSDVLELIDDSGEEFRKYLYYTSAKTI